MVSDMSFAVVHWKGILAWEVIFGLEGILAQLVLFARMLF